MKGLAYEDADQVWYKTDWLDDFPNELPLHRLMYSAVWQQDIHLTRCTDENVKMKVVATSSQTCKVVIESSSRSILNLLNFGANKGNVSDLSDYINNEVYKLCQPGEIPMVPQGNDHSTIRIVPPEIRFK